MTEKDLDNTFVNYITTFAKVRLIGIYNFNLYSHFPLRIPKELQSRFTGGLESIISVQANNSSKESVTIPQDIADFIKASLILVKHDNEKTKDNLDQILLRQELITFFAYLEAYFQDIQRFLYHYDNSLLSTKDRSFSWEEILNSQNFDVLISNMIDKKLEKSGYTKIHDLIQQWKKPPFEIIVRLKKDQLRYLEKYTLIRNAVIHNNSRISIDILKFHNVQKLRQGDLLEFSFEEIFKLYDFICWLLFETFSTIKIKYFSSEYNTLCDQYNYIRNYSPDIE